MRVGLTGGIGSGKSQVARVFSDLGALVIDTDVLARDAVAPGSDAIAEIGRLFPSAVVNGTLDRAALAAIVFRDDSARERVNAVVHPEVRRLAEVMEERAAPGQPIVHVVPLLFETGYDRRVDRTVVVIADDEERVRRIVGRDGSDERHARDRMRAQINPETARQRADYVIDNNGDLAALQLSAAEIYKRILSEAS